MNTFVMAKQALLHPIDFFHDVQSEGRARVIRAVIMIVLTIAVRLLSLALVSFEYETREPYQISVVTETLMLLVSWFTWVVANWGVSSIQNGEGKFKEIIVASAFAFTPYILFTIPLSLLTNVMSLQESSIYTALTYFIYIWVLYLLIMSVKILHDFELPKLMLVLILTVIGMLVIWFVFMMVYGLLNQAYFFLLDLYKEIRYRV